MAGYDNDFTKDDIPQTSQQSSSGYNNFVSGGQLHPEAGKGSSNAPPKFVGRLPGNTRGMGDSDFKSDG